MSPMEGYHICVGDIVSGSGSVQFIEDIISALGDIMIYVGDIIIALKVFHNNNDIQ